MNIKNLHSILKGNISLIDKVNVYDTALFTDNVPIHPQDIEKMLHKFLDGEITENELSKWAAFLSIRGEYCNPDLKVENEDFYQDMWDVIYSLSTPEIDGVINDENVKKYLIVLKKYENQ